jgi:hypothetical protein
MNHRAGLPSSGRPETQDLALAAIEALERGGLRDEIRLLQERVLSRPASELMERIEDDERGERWTFLPMVELLLREVRAVALQTRSRDERRHDIVWLLDTAGF